MCAGVLLVILLKELNYIIKEIKDRTKLFCYVVKHVF